MNIQERNAYQRDALLGVLGALLMLVGDLCLSVIPASSGDRGLFAREAYLNGSWEPWRLPLRSDFLPCALPTARYGRSTARPEWRFWRAA